MPPRFNPNAQGPTAEISAEEAQEFTTPVSKSKKCAEKLALLNSKKQLALGADGKTSQIERQRRNHQGLCFYCGYHSAKEQCRLLKQKNAAAAIKAAKDAGRAETAPVVKEKQNENEIRK
ncbi:hypothetical protein CBER1_06852 [Cercospora berteroae]|uniref:Uncharacterized protein n=1 Tax=Cercospora berteroae TaxID=357750 RepID=A0A2S6C4R7_9PEZI|nr:hypothetical protein CBER1_06852 [Cercospora berteroae]